MKMYKNSRELCTTLYFAFSAWGTTRQSGAVSC